MLIAGGGIHYSDAHAALERFADTAGIPVVETFAGKGAVTRDAWWQVGGVGLEGNFASNSLVKQADLVISVGTRLTDFATGSQSVFENDAVRFASLNVVDADTRKQGAVGILADARLGLEALTAGAGRPHHQRVLARHGHRGQGRLGADPRRGAGPRMSRSPVRSIPTPRSPTRC